MSAGKLPSVSQPGIPPLTAPWMNPMGLKRPELLPSQESSPGLPPGLPFIPARLPLPPPPPPVALLSAGSHTGLPLPAAPLQPTQPTQTPPQYSQTHDPPGSAALAVKKEDLEDLRATEDEEGSGDGSEELDAQAREDEIALAAEDENLDYEGGGGAAEGEDMEEGGADGDVPPGDPGDDLPADMLTVGSVALKNGRWKACRIVNGKNMSFGTAPTKRQAAIMHDRGVIRTIGARAARKKGINFDLGVHDDSVVRDAMKDAPPLPPGELEKFKAILLKMHKGLQARLRKAAERAEEGQAAAAREGALAAVIPPPHVAVLGRGKPKRKPGKSKYKLTEEDFSDAEGNFQDHLGLGPNHDVYSSEDERGVRRKRQKRRAPGRSAARPEASSGPTEYGGPTEEEHGAFDALKLLAGAAEDDIASPGPVRHMLAAPHLPAAPGASFLDLPDGGARAASVRPSAAGDDLMLLGPADTVGTAARRQSAVAAPPAAMALPALPRTYGPGELPPAADPAILSTMSPEACYQWAWDVLKAARSLRRHERSRSGRHGGDEGRAGTADTAGEGAGVGEEEAENGREAGPESRAPAAATTPAPPDEAQAAAAAAPGPAPSISGARASSPPAEATRAALHETAATPQPAEAGQAPAPSPSQRGDPSLGPLETDYYTILVSRAFVGRSRVMALLLNDILVELRTGNLATPSDAVAEIEDLMASFGRVANRGN